MNYKLFFLLNLFFFRSISNLIAQNESHSADQDPTSYKQVKTYINPVLPGDHPDPTLLKVGNDFYLCGSSFHFTPYLPIQHSTDLIHWEEISRAVPSSWPGLSNDSHGAGIWQGAITFFYGSYWIYFSNNAGAGQYFCKAKSPKGPWSEPVKVKTTSTTGTIGYDNSVFIDDDGTPYMLTKAGKYLNRIQKIGKDGHLTEEAINLDWMNADGKYSWAEGPVMCKRKGWYYYFIAGNVAGGQYVLRSQSLTSDSTKWEVLGNFFAKVEDPTFLFRSPNHISAPVQLKDGTWWAVGHSYGKTKEDDWSGQGRQGLLFQVIWDERGKPTGIGPSTTPFLKPQLNNQSFPRVFPRSDYFDNPTLKLSWHFLSKYASDKYSLTERSGWLRLKPSSQGAHLLQKEAGHYYTLVTRVDINPTSESSQGGILITNGNQSVAAKLYSGYSDGRKIIFSLNDTVYKADNPYGNSVWLKLDRREHSLTGYYSSDGLNWKQIGRPINAAVIDKSQPKYNWWVGTSIGLYAEGSSVDFDLFSYKDGHSPLPIAGYNNFFGVQTFTKATEKVVTNTTSNGGWLMLGGVELGINSGTALDVEVSAASLTGGNLEVWIDNIENKGTKIATIPISNTGSEETFKTFKSVVRNISGQHDVYLRFPPVKNAFYLNTIRFIPKNLDLTLK